MQFAASANVALGNAGLLLMLAASTVGALTTAGAVKMGNTKALKQSQVYAWLIAIGAVLAVAMMQRALFTRDYSMAYIQQVGSNTTPTTFNIAAMWSALEGSILLWVLVSGAVHGGGRVAIPRPKR